MERVRRALELAKAQRAQAAAALPVAQAQAALLVEPLVDTAESAPHAAAPPAPPPPVAEPAAEQGVVRYDTTGRFLRSRLAEVDAEHLRRGRLLAPGMQGPAAKAFRMLRTQVMQRMSARGWNSLAIVSAMPGDGKTTVAINLAMAISMDPGHSALLVDFDLRQPSVATRLGITAEPGVEQCLTAGRPVAEAFVRLGGYDRLMILPAGGAVEHSSELLGSEATRALVTELRSRYRDRVLVFDLPPLLGSDDALAFAPQVDALLLVIAEGGTREDELLRSFELVKDRPVIGTVLNRSRAADASGYGY